MKSKKKWLESLFSTSREILIRKGKRMKKVKKKARQYWAWIIERVEDTNTLIEFAGYCVKLWSVFRKLKKPLWWLFLVAFPDFLE